MLGSVLESFKLFEVIIGIMDEVLFGDIGEIGDEKSFWRKLPLLIAASRLANGSNSDVSQGLLRF